MSEVSKPHQSPESTCAQCERRNPVWWVDDDIWNRVMGTPDNPRGEGVIVCPSCFSRDLFEQLEAARAAIREIAKGPLDSNQLAALDAHVAYPASGSDS